jgi:hypothetical protein
MLSFVLLNVVLLNVVLLNVVMLNVVMLNVVLLMVVSSFYSLNKTMMRENIVTSLFMFVVITFSYMESNGSVEDTSLTPSIRQFLNLFSKSNFFKWSRHS